MVTNFPGDDAHVRTVVADPRGGIVVAAFERTNDEERSYLRRLTESGQVDNEFGVAGDFDLVDTADALMASDAGIFARTYDLGIVDIDYSGRVMTRWFDSASAFAFDGAGGLWAGASASQEPMSVNHLVAPGALDSSFGLGGAVTYPVPEGHSWGAVEHVWPTADGVVALMESRVNGIYEYEVSLVRLDSRGSPVWNDPGGRKIILPLARIADAWMQADGKILLLYLQVPEGGSFDDVTYYLRRFEADGSVDTTFGDDGDVAFADVNDFNATLHSEGGFLMMADGASDGTSYFPRVRRLWL
jgi:hypothetical protein